MEAPGLQKHFLADLCTIWSGWSGDGRQVWAFDGGGLRMIEDCFATTHGTVVFRQRFHAYLKTWNPEEV